MLPAATACSEIRLHDVATRSVDTGRDHKQVVHAAIRRAVRVPDEARLGMGPFGVMKDGTMLAPLEAPPLVAIANSGLFAGLVPPIAGWLLMACGAAVGISPCHIAAAIIRNAAGRLRRRANDPGMHQGLRDGADNGPQVDPVLTDLNGLTVPVRIIIGADGKMEHVHVISATPAQRQAIEQALPQWQFKPFAVTGHPTAVETGLSFQFKSQRQ